MVHSWDRKLAKKSKTWQLVNRTWRPNKKAKNQPAFQIHQRFDLKTIILHFENISNSFQKNSKNLAEQELSPDQTQGEIQEA